MHRLQILPVWTALGLLLGLAGAAGEVRAQNSELRNDAYVVALQPSGAVTVQALPDGKPVTFEPRFVAWHNAAGVTNVTVKSERPVYNLLGWKLAEGRTERDLYRAGDTIELNRPVVTSTAEEIRWKFADERLDVDASVSISPGKAEPRIGYSMTVKRAGTWSMAYAGAPAADLENVVELFQPLVWDGLRLPEEAILIPDDQCSIPGCLVETAAGTVGVMVDPRQFPFEMPSHLVRRFGVAVRNSQGQAQPLCFTPLPGFADSQLKPGDTRTYFVALVARQQSLSRTFEHVAREICGFRDRRENTVATLNVALDRMLEFAQSKWGNFDPANKAYSYPDAHGTVKNVSSLHPLGLALATDNESLFREQGVPILEFLLSREKFLFALSPEGMKSSQSPSRKMAGPAMPVSELAALRRFAPRGMHYFSDAADKLFTADRTLNMDWVSRGDSWKNELWRYRSTGKLWHLGDARLKADRYLAQRIDRQPTDFSEAANGTFFEYMLPDWKELYELYQDSRDPRHLAAAHRGARRYAQLIWFYPAVPDGDITVNESGFAPRRGSLDKPGLIPVPKMTVPAWRVSEQGLACEGNGTVQRLALFLATHAPWFMRIGHDADDEFLRAIGRSAMVGRFANFPGYHFNTKYSTAHELADFPLRPFDELKPTTSMHYNHILPMANLVLDYLVSDAYARSRGQVDFPGEFAESYAFMQGRVFGARPGKFYGLYGAQLWMPRGLITPDHDQVNYVAARSGGRLCLAFMNECDRPLEEVSFQVNPAYFQKSLQQNHVATVWQDGRDAGERVLLRDGRGTISLSPRGITAVMLENMSPKVAFQDQLSSTATFNRRYERFAVPVGEAQTVVLSFGPKLTWLYTYLTADDGQLQSASLHVTMDGQTQTITDESFPFEFSLPLTITAKELKLRVEVTAPQDQAAKSSEKVRLLLN